MENTGADNIPEVVLIHGEEKMSDSILDGSNDPFLQFQDAVETPKEWSSRSQFKSQAEISWQLLVNWLTVIQN